MKAAEQQHCLYARVFDGLPGMAEWRRTLAGRPSVRNAVTAEYAERLADFLRRKDSALSRMMETSGIPFRQTA